MSQHVHVEALVSKVAHKTVAAKRNASDHHPGGNFNLIWLMDIS